MLQEDPAYVLTDDYLAGLYIGDGSVEFRIRFSKNCKNILFSHRFSITVSKDSRTACEAIRRKIGAGTIISKNKGSNFQYSLDANGPLRNSLVPCLSQFKMPYSKQRQFNIIKESIVLTDQGKYKTKDDLFYLIELWHELRLFHQSRGRITKEQRQSQVS